MKKVFIGGSRSVRRLTPAVRKRLDQVIKTSLLVLVGDANGADKAVQSYLHERSYQKVEIYCMENGCRNNLGDWRVHIVNAPQNKKGFEYFSTKDLQMAHDASVGLMLWDGRSRGTLANMVRLIDLHKKVVVYVSPFKHGVNLGSWEDLEMFLGQFGPRIQHEANLHRALWAGSERQLDLY